MGSLSVARKTIKEAEVTAQVVKEKKVVLREKLNEGLTEVKQTAEIVAEEKERKSMLDQNYLHKNAVKKGDFIVFYWWEMMNILLYLLIQD